MVRWATVSTPIGPVRIGEADGAVRAVQLAATGYDSPPEDAGRLLTEAQAQVRAYFAGERLEFELPLVIAPERGSDFERAVWQELRGIGYGEQRTYGEIAAAVGDSGAARAVGTACNRNPVPLLVPCHRVVGAGGKLVGFGGGLPRKRWLLEHEARITMERGWR